MHLKVVKTADFAKILFSFHIGDHRALVLGTILRYLGFCDPLGNIIFRKVKLSYYKTFLIEIYSSGHCTYQSEYLWQLLRLAPNSPAKGMSSLGQYFSFFVFCFCFCLYLYFFSCKSLSSRYYVDYHYGLFWIHVDTQLCKFNTVISVYLQMLSSAKNILFTLAETQTNLFCLLRYSVFITVKTYLKFHLQRMNVVLQYL